MPQNIEEWLSLAPWLAGAGHFCVLIASFQVPYRLHWKEDLAKLDSFNRKLMWVHGGFTVYTIIAFGAMTLALHEEILRGDRAALALAFFIGIYWLLRIITRTGTGRAAQRFGSGTPYLHLCSFFSLPAILA